MQIDHCGRTVTIMLIRRQHKRRGFIAAHLLCKLRTGDPDWSDSLTISEPEAFSCDPDDRG